MTNCNSCSHPEHFPNKCTVVCPARKRKPERNCSFLELWQIKLEFGGKNILHLNPFGIQPNSLIIKESKF
jgi:hypothetical protein